MILCNGCIHTTVCGEKVNYKKYVEEFNELNNKYDIFEKNPKCPSFMAARIINAALDALMEEDKEDIVERLDNLAKEMNPIDLDKLFQDAPNADVEEDVKFDDLDKILREYYDELDEDEDIEEDYTWDELLKELFDKDIEDEDDDELDEDDEDYEEIEEDIIDSILKCSADFITTEGAWEKKLFGDIPAQDRMKIKRAVVEDVLSKMFK